MIELIVVILMIKMCIKRICYMNLSVYCFTNSYGSTCSYSYLRILVKAKYDLCGGRYIFSSPLKPCCTHSIHYWIFETLDN
jgi:hypothetical protein